MISQVAAGMAVLAEAGAEIVASTFPATDTGGFGKVNQLTGNVADLGD